MLYKFVTLRVGGQKAIFVLAILALSLTFEQAVASTETDQGIEIPSASSFQDSSIIAGLSGATAYTLSQDEWMIGYLHISPYAPLLGPISIRYGLTNNLELGANLPTSSVGTLSILGRYKLCPTLGITVAVPLGFQLHPFSYDTPFHTPTRPYVSVSSGASVSWAASEKLGVHAGIRTQVSRLEGFEISFVYGIADFTLLSNTKLLGKFDYYPVPFLGSAFAIRVGGLMRILGILNLKVMVAHTIPSYRPSFFNDIGIKMFVKF